jgi:hypothetical protein
MPPFPKKLKYQDSEKALDMRMSGEILEIPQLSGQILDNIILKAYSFSNASDDDKLYKVSIEGSERTRLNDDKTWDINVIGDWIYYSNKSDGDKLNKLRY